MDFDPFCLFLCFKLSCFVFGKHRKFYLGSKIFFNFFTLKHGKFRFQRWNCSYRASKSRGNTATEGWKRTGTFPLTFTFADKRSGCYGNGLICVAEKFEFGACSIWIVEDVGRAFSSPEPVVCSSRGRETMGCHWSVTNKAEWLWGRKWSAEVPPSSRLGKIEGDSVRRVLVSAFAISARLFSSSPWMRF